MLAAAIETEVSDFIKQHGSLKLTKVNWRWLEMVIYLRVRFKQDSETLQSKCQRNQAQEAGYSATSKMAEQSSLDWDQQVIETLAEARDTANDMRRAIARGQSPKEAFWTEKPGKIFAAYARECIEQNKRIFAIVKQQRDY